MHPTGGSLRVFRQFAWLGVGSGKKALSRPAHQRVTQAVGRLKEKRAQESNRAMTEGELSNETSIAGYCRKDILGFKKNGLVIPYMLRICGARWYLYRII